jgi:hypothetical protein
MPNGQIIAQRGFPSFVLQTSYHQRALALA